MENIANNRPQNIEEKLNMILKMIRSDGRAIADSSRRLADKIAGPEPTECGGECPKSITDHAHAILDDIGRELNAVFHTTTCELDRSHRSIGEFGRDRSLKEASLAQYAQQSEIAKVSRY